MCINHREWQHVCRQRVSHETDESQPCCLHSSSTFSSGRLQLIMNNFTPLAIPPHLLAGYYCSSVLHTQRESDNERHRIRLFLHKHPTSLCGHHILWPDSDSPHPSRLFPSIPGGLGFAFLFTLSIICPNTNLQAIYILFQDHKDKAASKG